MSAILMHLNHSDLKILRDSVKARMIRAKQAEEKCRAVGLTKAADFAFVERDKARGILARLEMNLKRVSE